MLVISDKGDRVIANREYDTSFIAPNNHYEADTKAFLHLLDAVRSGHSKVFIRTVDSDLVIIAIALFLQIENLSHLWIGFGKGKHYYDIAVHDIARKLGKDKAYSLLLFHAISGCDTVSQPNDVGNKTAWAKWELMPDLTTIFNCLLIDPFIIDTDPEIIRKLERFMIVCYSSTCSAITLDEARLKLFETGTKVLETLPPTSAAFYQHVRRAILQGCFLWKQCLVAMQDIPPYSEWGWTWDSKMWVPLWTTKETASAACRFLKKCGCQKACRGWCKCVKRGERCSTLCACGASCTNNGEDL